MMKMAKGIISTHKIILLGICLGVVYGVIDSVVDVYFFTGHTIVENLFSPPPSEIWMRASVLIIFILFSVYVSRIINMRKLAEEALETNVSHLISIMNNTDDFIMIADKDGFPVVFNDAYKNTVQNVFGIEMEPGLQPHTLLPDKVERQKWDDIHRDVLSGEARRLEYEVPLKDEIRIFEFSLSPIITGEAINGFVEITRDVTERKKSESQLRKAQEITGIGFWDLNLVTGELFWSDVIYGMLGFKPGEIVPNYEIFMDRVHPDDRDRVQQNVDAALNDDVPYNVDFRYLFPTGEIRHVNPQAEVTRDESGKAIRLFGTQQDITERKKAQNEINMLALISKQTAEGITAVDLDGFITFTNKAWADMHGLTVDDVIGKHLSIFHTNEQLENDVMPFNKLVKEKGSHTGEVGHKRIDGTVFPTFMTTTVLKDERDEQFAMVGFAIDITKQKQLEQDLRNTIRDKEMLIKEVHHRVKNNFGMIQSLLHLQLKDISDDKSKEYFDDAQNRVKCMTTIHKMLQDSDDLKKLKTMNYMHRLVATLFHSYKADSKVIRLHQDIDDVLLDVDTMIPLGLIINELVSNALKYAFPDGAEGELSISLKETGESNYELTVKDTGEGLPEDLDMEKAESLGLKIVYSLMKQLKGKLEVSNKDGAEIRIAFEEKTHT